MLMRWMVGLWIPPSPASFPPAAPPPPPTAPVSGAGQISELLRFDAKLEQRNAGGREPSALPPPLLAKPARPCSKTMAPEGQREGRARPSSG
jgi:hypothetical protein